MYGDINQWVAHHIEIYCINIHLSYLLILILIAVDFV